MGNSSNLHLNNNENNTNNTQPAVGQHAWWVIRNQISSTSTCTNEWRSTMSLACVLGKTGTSGW